MKINRSKRFEIICGFECFENLLIKTKTMIACAKLRKRKRIFETKQKRAEIRYCSGGTATIIANIHLSFKLEGKRRRFYAFRRVVLPRPTLGDIVCIVFTIFSPAYSIVKQIPVIVLATPTQTSRKLCLLFLNIKFCHQ